MFFGIMLEVKDMLEEDQLYHFMKGPQPLEQSEFHCLNMYNLTLLIAIVDKLLDYEAGSSKGKDVGVSAFEKQNNKNKFRNKVKASRKSKDKAKKSNALKEKNCSKTINCWVYGNNHYKKDCPFKQQNVNLIE